MKIVASAVALNSTHQAWQKDQGTSSLRAWGGSAPMLPPANSSQATAFVTEISAAGRQALTAGQNNAVPPAPDSSRNGAAEAIENARAALENDPIYILIRAMLAMLTGETVHRLAFADGETTDRASLPQDSAAPTVSQGSPAGTPAPAGWGVEYDAKFVHEEAEVTTFSAAASIQTADGREIRLTLNLEMQRTYHEETQVSLRAGDARRKDPLVLNFAGEAARLAGLDGARFQFDLDADGATESLPTFASGSGYLALDRNANGEVDNGLELFGPATDHGFEELSRLDEDGNGWIDAGDAAFQRLSVWTPAAAGPGTLKTLTELGIGALGLDYASTPFALRDQQNSDLGQVRATGIHLAENGQAGSLQEIDLTV